jgi:hypothetical protein
MQGQEPWTNSEKYLKYLKDDCDDIRRGMLTKLEKPWAAYCTADATRI